MNIDLGMVKNLILLWNNENRNMNNGMFARKKTSDII